MIAMSGLACGVAVGTKPVLFIYAVVLCVVALAVLLAYWATWGFTGLLALVIVVRYIGDQCLLVVPSGCCHWKPVVPFGGELIRHHRTAGAQKHGNHSNERLRDEFCSIPGRMVSMPLG